MFSGKDIIRLLTTIALTIALAPLRSEAQINTNQVVTVGRNAMYFEDYLVAIQYFNQAIAAKPYLAQPYFYRAIAKYNLEDYLGAEADASKTIELNPFITDAWEVRGVARQNLGDNAGAISDYKHALTLLPNNRQLMFNMAAAQTEVKDYAGADSTFTAILTHYPGFENAYLGRARMRSLQGDTIGSRADIDKALSINADSYNAHIMLSELAMQQGRDSMDTALEHLEQAIRLQPKIAGLYINRAYLRYLKDNWTGAMEDYDMAINLEPENTMARFNRGLLNMEVSGYDTAVADFTAVLDRTPNDVRALYNRAYALSNKHEFQKAIADADHIISLMPDYPAGYAMRSDINRRSGNLAAAKRDHDKAASLSRRLTYNEDGTAGKAPTGQDEELTEADLTKREFATLLTVDDNTDFREEYNNSAIRGRIQDRNINVNLEPMAELTYYPGGNQISTSIYYTADVDAVNASRTLPHTLYLSIGSPSNLDEETAQKHFKSIDYYNSYLANHRPRTIDYIGRALDFMSVHNYQGAVSDLDKAIALTPDFGVAYMLRAQANARILDAGVGEPGDKGSDRAVLEHAAINNILADLDVAIARSPRNPFIHYNKGNMLMRMGNIAEAIDAYTTAINLDPGFGQAYFNRGYARFKAGDKAAGSDDLSRAGQHGIVGAYNLLKRISK